MSPSIIRISTFVKSLALPIILFLSVPNANAQSFLGSFEPEATKKSESTAKQGEAKAKNKTTKKVNLPDKPNKVDAKGRKQGEWAAKYPNGRYRYTATFKDDAPIGKVTRFDDDGRKTVMLTYKAGNDTISATFYFSNGKVQSKGKYVDEKREGFWLFYNEKGELVESASYSQGKLHGKRCFYFENGKLLSACQWVDSLRNGLYMRYFPSGSKEIVANFRGDELDGLYTRWGADGKVAEKGNYRYGVTVGRWHYRYAEANVEGDVEYDSYGRPKGNALDSLLYLRQQYYEKNKYNLVDPEQYSSNPDELLRSSGVQIR